MIIDPRNLTIKRWADQMVLELAKYGTIPQLTNEAYWREWSETLCAIPEIAGFNPPSHRLFSNFYSWAEQFIRVVP